MTLPAPIPHMINEAKASLDIMESYLRERRDITQRAYEAAAADDRRGPTDPILNELKGHAKEACFNYERFMEVRYFNDV